MGLILNYHMSSLSWSSTKVGREQIPEVSLSSGQRMPLIGMTTPTTSPSYLHLFSHFDTASPDGSEEPLGQAVA